MRQALADTAAAGQDDRPSAGGDVDMVDQGAAAPDPQVPTGVSLSKAQNESLAKMTGERKRQLLQIKTADEMEKMQPPLKKACVEAALLLRGHKPAINSRRTTADVGMLKKRSGAQCAAHGLARVQTAFSTSRTSEVPADLRMGAS